MYSGNTIRYVTPFPNLDTAIMQEYMRFLVLFVGVPYGYISPPPLWPALRNGPADPAILRKIWRFHSQQASYGEDCLISTGRKIPFYEYEDGPDRGDGPKDAGLLELDFRGDAGCELAFFGLTPDQVGGQAGRWLMNEALTRAWDEDIWRLFVHTCTLDHPKALAFYIRSGFTPYKRCVEVSADARLTGHLPKSSAPQIPLL